MARLLLAFTLLFYEQINGDFVIEGLQNIQKRSIEKPADDIDIYSININSKVTSRFAHNVITSRTVNQANVSKEVIFNVDLPKTAFITNFSIASGRKTEKFTVSVNVASESKVTFELIYEEMLRRNLGKYEILIKVQPKTLVKNFQIDVDIHEPQGISFLDAQATFLTNDLMSAIKKSFSGEKGHVTFNPTLDQQRSCPNCSTTLLDGDFSVTYDVNRESPGNIEIINGYFVHFFAPSKLAGVPKNVIYVIDRSGSMSGRKIQQTREALHQILNDTAECDHFNFILFDHKVHLWRDSLAKATPENLAKARQFIKTITDRGSTNINDPLLKAVELLNKAHEIKQVPERSVSLIILLTDGQANYGESNTSKIQENVKKAIKGRYTLYSLGFGYGVDYLFLEKMALENSGVARRIFEDSDAALQLQGFYTEIANPTLLNIEMQYPENAIADLTQNSFKHYFDGSEIVVAGRITDNGLNLLNVDINAEGAEKPLKYSENITLQDKGEVGKQQYIFGDFTERLWAYLTIQQLLEKRIHADQSEKANLTAEIVDLSLKFQFVTPVTSMVVTKPEEQDKKEETLIADKFVEGQSSAAFPPSFVAAPHLHSSVTRPRYPAPQNWVDSDPHFLINVPQKNDALCFNIQEKPGMVLTLIKDKELGIAVNGELIGKETSNGVMPNVTFFGKLGIVNRKMKVKIEVTTETVTIMSSKYKKMFTWEEKASINKHGWNMVINQKRNMTLWFGEGATFFIILHQVWKDYPRHMGFLGFYTVDDHKFTRAVHGLLGQFFHGIDYEISNIHKTNKHEKLEATMTVKNKLINVTRGSQKDYKTDHRNGKKVDCWFVRSNGEGLIDGTHTDYIVPDIFTLTD